MPEKKVTVTVSSGKIAVEPVRVEVHKAQDNVKWVCDTSAFTIDMPGYTINYKQEGGKHVGVSGTFPTEGRIKYDVSAPSAETLDPEVDVIPVV